MSQMKMHTSHMATAAQAEGLFSCANIALILDTILLVSIFVILAALVRLVALVSLISLLVIISIRIINHNCKPKDTCHCFA